MVAVTAQTSLSVFRPCASRARLLTGSSGKLNRELAVQFQKISIPIGNNMFIWLGDNGFDPLGLAEDPENLKWFMQAELVNGRWAMLGVAGMLLPEVLTGAGIITVPKWYDAGKAQRWQDIKNPGSVNQGPILKQCSLPPNEVGYGGGTFNPLNFATSLEAKEKEIANGKITISIFEKLTTNDSVWETAMLAFLGFIVQHNVTGKGPSDNLLQHLSDPWHNTIIEVWVTDMFCGFNVADTGKFELRKLGGNI
uniref:Chlorophyll a-b binding protein, chloroplastic n=1 Tax=Kalanchoe fedtschenkoi TaxID=63787 RepID=A0A7N0UB26_KALFE